MFEVDSAAILVNHRMTLLPQPSRTFRTFPDFFIFRCSSSSPSSSDMPVKRSHRIVEVTLEVGAKWSESTILWWSMCGRGRNGSARLSGDRPINAFCSCSPLNRFLFVLIVGGFQIECLALPITSWFTSDCLPIRLDLSSSLSILALTFPTAVHSIRPI